MGNKLQTEYTPLIEQNGPKKIKKTCIFIAVIVCMAAFIALGFYFKYLLGSLNADPNARADEDWALFKVREHTVNNPQFSKGIYLIYRLLTTRNIHRLKILLEKRYFYAIEKKFGVTTPILSTPTRNPFIIFMTGSFIHYIFLQSDK
jgi:hypothetical protein